MKLSFYGLSLSDFPDLSFSIDDKANAIWADWVALAQRHQPARLKTDRIGECDPGIEVRYFLLDVWDIIAKADPEKRDNEQACLNYLQRLLREIIRLRWSVEFLTATQDRKIAHWLHSLISHLTNEDNRAVMLAINRMANYTLENQFDDLGPGYQVQEDDMNGIFLLADLQADETWKFVKEYLVANHKSVLLATTESDKGIEPDEISNYFTLPELKELINLNPYL